MVMLAAESAEQVTSPRAEDVGALVGALGRVRWQLGLERLLLLGARGVFGSSLVLIGLSVGSWLLATPDAMAAWAWLSLVPLLAALTLGMLRWPSPRAAAIAADRRLGLDERLATALELIGTERPLGRSRQPDRQADRPLADLRPGRFDGLQVRDALAHIQATPAAAGLGPERGVWRQAGLAVACLTLAALVTLLVPHLPGAPRVGASSPDPGAAAGAAQAPLPTEVPAQVAQDASIVTAPLDAQLVQPSPPDPNLADRVEQEQAERSALDNLSQALDSVSAAQPAADAIQQGDFSAAKDQLGNLGEQADQLSQPAKQQLAKALQQAANQTTATDRALADRERQAAQALSRPNSYPEQRQALHNLADQVERSGARSASADQLQRDSAQLQQQQQQQTASSAGAAGPSAARGQASGAQGRTSSAARPAGVSQAGQASRAGTQPGQAGTQSQPGAAGAPGGEPGDAAGQPNDGTPANGQPGGTNAGGDQGGAGAGQSGASGTGNGVSSDLLGNQPSRLDSSGQVVQVPTQLGSGAAVRPATGAEDQTGTDPSTGSRSVAERVQPQQTGQVAPEQNLVSGEQRPIVRGYFR